MSPIRLGVIGLSPASGRWASTALIPPLFDPLLSSKYTITAIATRSLSSAQASAAKYAELTGHKVNAYYGENGARDIANDENVDLVVVSVKIPDHWEAVKPAIEAGKDVFVEWSPGRNFEETVRIAEAAKARGVRTIVGAQSAHSATSRKLKELVDSGKLGKVVSTSLSLVIPPDLGFAGKTTPEANIFSFDADNGATLLTVAIAHHLTNLSYILGELKQVSATTAILYPDVQVLDASGKPTGKTIKRTAPDQVVLTGVLGGKHDSAIVTIHVQAGPALGRLVWYIDGDEGVIEARNRPENGTPGLFAGLSEFDVLLNDEKVALDTREEDRLGSTGKAWLEYAKGEKGRYETLEHSVAIWRVLDAALKSADEGGKTVAVVQS